MTETENEHSKQNLWQKTQDRLAERAGLSVLMVDGHQPPALAVSNNNSICRVVQSSKTHANRCEPFCGAAFHKTTEAGKAISYRCHAGLFCVAAPVSISEKPLAAIVGRAFVQTADYRDLTERIFLGDWQNLPETELFENINISGSLEDLERLAARLQNLNEEEKSALRALTKAEPIVSVDEIAVLPEAELPAISPSESEDILELEATETVFEQPEISEVLFLDEEDLAAGNSSEEINLDLETDEPNLPENLPEANLVQMWRERIGASQKRNYSTAAVATIDFVSEQFGLNNLAWLEWQTSVFKVLAQKGELRGDRLRIGLDAEDARLRQAAANGGSLRLENKKTGEEIELFPVAANAEEIRAAIVVGEHLENENQSRRLNEFLAEIALHLEILRLREEVEERARLQAAIKKFSQDLQAVEADVLLDAVVETSLALVGARRGSLLFFDENEGRLKAAAAAGTRAEEIKNESKNLGERAAFRVWQESAPLVVADAAQIGLPPAQPERGYQSKSFLSLPLSFGGKKIGVLNVTDKQNDRAFDETDVSLLEAVAPQIAAALDRAVLHRKAGEYETASITDSLTGLLNRRYLEARLEEEIRRSQRHGYPLGFMMIDVDYFKRFNDRFGHQAGDEALKLVANSLRASLRSADVAARYGGEEFSILLPQTTLSEARSIAERIRRRVEMTVSAHDKITVSIGVSSYTQKLDTPEAVIRAADEALYEAKRAGRNNVQIYTNGTGGTFAGNADEPKEQYA